MKGWCWIGYITKGCVAAVLVCAAVFAAGCSKEEIPPAEDTKPPVAGTPITFSDIRYNSVTLSWGEAQDEVTPKERLQYRVVSSSTYITINTVSECANITGDAVLRDWAEYVPSLSISDLTPETVYWYAVLVRDEKGNMALYYPQQVRTLADDAPRPGTAITFSDRAETSLKVQWGIATDLNYPSEQLEYRLVKSDSATKIDTVNEALAVSGADLIQDWTTNFYERTVTGLTMGTRYYFAVLVRNPRLKVALYSPKMTTTIDTEAPTPGGNVSFSGIESDRVTVNWPAATDNLTLQGDLYYKAVWASNASDIDTVAEANATSNVVMSWSRNKLSATAADLSEYTVYYYAVLVKDEQNNMALYSPQLVRTKDIHAPTVPVIETQGGIDYYVAYSNVQGTSLNITWKQADDPDPGTETGSLKYRLVWAYSADDIDQAYKIAASSNVVSGYDWVSGSTLSWNIHDQHTAAKSGLTSETTYYFALAVKDLDGNMSVYAPRMVRTKDVTPPTPGTLTISPNDVHSTWVKLTFTEASDTNYPKEQLQYRVKRGTTIIHEWATYANNYDTGLKADGLTNNTEYTFSVEVKDPDDNTASYSSVPVTTHSSWEPLGIEDFANMDGNTVVLRIIGGNPHVAYLDGDSARRQYVTVQKYASGSWSAVGAAGCSGEVALQVDLEADGSGNPYIGYVAYNNDSPIAKVMKYASSWSGISGIPAPGGIIEYCDLAMNANSPAILVVDRFNDSGTIQHVPKVFEYGGDPAAWNPLGDIANVGLGEDAYIFASLSYSGSLPYVSFNDVAHSNKLTVNKYESPAWNLVGSAGFSSDFIMFSQLAFDSANTPHLAYLENGTEGMVVRVKKYSGSAWADVGTSPINTGGYASALSLAITGTTPYIAFSDSTKNYKARVMRLKSDGSAWEYVEHASANNGISPGAISSISIDLDSSGNPYIAFGYNNRLTVLVYK